MSVLLVTLLTGIGYEAFVCVGTADREVTLCDFRYRACEAVAPIPPEPEPDRTPQNKYLRKIQNRAVNLVSDFEEKKAHPAPPPPAPIPRPDPPADDFAGKRAYAWVLVKSGRVEIPNPVFVDAPSGERFELSSPLFGHIEMAFNHQNVWVNMQAEDVPKTEESLNFEEHELWKPVIEPEKLRIPSPVVERLDVTEDRLFNKFPEAEQLRLWKDAFQQNFAPHTRPDGLVQRFFLLGKDLDDVREVREYFQSLRGCLVYRVLRLRDEQMDEKFEPGHPTAIVAHTIKHGKWRSLEFDSEQRLDCLKTRRDVFGDRIVEEFQGRDDGLIQRKLRVVPDSSAGGDSWDLFEGGPRIARITEKYERKRVRPSVASTFPMTENACKVWFDAGKRMMGIVFHHQPGRITQFAIDYKDVGAKDRGECVPEPSQFDPSPPEIDEWYKKQLQKHLLELREKRLGDARRLANEIVSWIRWRCEEEAKPFLKLTPVDVVLHRKLYAEGKVSIEEPPPEPRGDEGQGDTGQQQVSMSDPLSVYFPIEGGEITQQVAEAIFTRATEALHARLVEEHANLQNRLAQETQHAKKKQQDFELDQHQSMSKKQTDDHNEYIAKQKFLIAVLQKRLDRFPATAARRLFDLMKSLKNHPKLAPFLGRTEVTEAEVVERIKGAFPTPA